MESVPGAVATRSPSRFQARCTTTRPLPRLCENSLDTNGFSRVVHQLQPNQSQTLFVIPSASAAWSFQFWPILLEKQSWMLKLKLHAAEADGICDHPSAIHFHHAGI